MHGRQAVTCESEKTHINVRQHSHVTDFTGWLCQTVWVFKLSSQVAVDPEGIKLKLEMDSLFEKQGRI